MPDFEHFGLSTIGSGSGCRLQFLPNVLQRSTPPLPGAVGMLPGVIMAVFEVEAEVVEVVKVALGMRGTSTMAFLMLVLVLAMAMGFSM